MREYYKCCLHQLYENIEIERAGNNYYSINDFVWLFLRHEKRLPWT